MSGGKKSTQIFAIKAGDHTEGGRLRKVERIADAYHGRGDFEILRFSDRQCRSDRIDLQHRNAATDVGDDLFCGIGFALELDGEIFRVAANRVSRVKGAGWINEKSGAENIAVFIDAVNFN